MEGTVSGAKNNKVNNTDKMQVNNATTSDTVKCHSDHQIYKGESDQKMGMVGALIRVMRKGLPEVTSEQRDLERREGGKEESRSHSYATTGHYYIFRNKGGRRIDSSY